GIHSAGPRPRTRVAFVADLRDFCQVDRAHQVRDVGGGGVVRGVGADADPGCLRQEHPFDGNTHEVALELALDELACPRGQLALDLYSITLAELGAQTRRHQIERTLAQ